MKIQFLAFGFLIATLIPVCATDYFFSTTNKVTANYMFTKVNEDVSVTNKPYRYSEATNGITARVNGTLYEGEVLAITNTVVAYGVLKVL